MNKLDEEQRSQLLDSPFECNICLDIATEPILTTCGHLYCWPCIYSWLSSNQEFLTCPVCKNGCSKNSLIPLYFKGDETQPKKARDPNIPPRPKPGRNDPVRNQQQTGFNNMANGVMIAGYGLFPSVSNLVYIKDGNIQQDERHENEAPIEVQMFKKIQGILLVVTLGLVLLIAFYI